MKKEKERYDKAQERFESMDSNLAVSFNTAQNLISHAASYFMR